MPDERPSSKRLPESPSEVTGDSTAAELFALLWESMADLLGTAATAALLRRAARRAASNHLGLNGVVIRQQGVVYDYGVPDAWHRALEQEMLEELRGLVQELSPVLVEMTGPVVMRRLAAVAPLHRLGIVSPEERPA